MRINKSTLLDEKEIKFGDFNVFVGGNGVGKTSLLVELYTKATNTGRTRYYWINKIDFESENILNDMKLLKDSLSRKLEASTLTYHAPSAKNIDGHVDLSENFSTTEYDQLETIKDNSVLSSSKYRKPFIAISSCEARLNFSDNAAVASLTNPRSN